MLFQGPRFIPLSPRTLTNWAYSPPLQLEKGTNYNHGGLSGFITEGRHTCTALSWLVSCWSLQSLQHVRWYQDEFRLVTVRTHGNLIMLSHWKFRPPKSWPRYPDTVLSSPCPILLMPSTRQGSKKYKLYKSLVSLDGEPNSGSPACKAYVLPIRPLGSEYSNKCRVVLSAECLCRWQTVSQSPSQK